MSNQQNNHEELEIIQDYIANKLHYMQQYEIEREMQKDILLNDAIEGLSTVSDTEVKKSMALLHKEFSSDAKSKSTMTIVAAIITTIAILAGVYFIAFHQPKSNQQISQIKTEQTNKKPVKQVDDKSVKTEPQPEKKPVEQKVVIEIPKKKETLKTTKRQDKKKVTTQAIVNNTTHENNQSIQYIEADAFTIEGKIIDTETKEGLQGVDISIVRSKYKSTSIGDGKYSLKAPPTDSTRHTLRFSKPNYKTVFAYPSPSGYTVVNMTKQTES